MHKQHAEKNACMHIVCFSSLQLAWSCNSKKFLVVGNGDKSSIALYTVGKEESDHVLRLAWVLPVKDCASVGSDGERSESSVQQTPAGGNDAANVGVDSGKNYPHQNAFYLAEFNPSGNIFAVEEVPYRTTMLHLVSPEGAVVHTVDLMAAIGDEECSKRPENTLFISPHHDSVYAIGVEGGTMALVQAESLVLKKAFKVVRS